MRRTAAFWAVAGMSVIGLTLSGQSLSAAELCWGKLAWIIKGSPLDVHCPQSENQCGKESCTERVPVADCVTGKKEVFDCKMRCEYVAVPETRYHWRLKYVTKEIPCPYCMPTCETEKVDHCYEAERWDRQDAGCGQLHCKSCEAKLEKLPCKHCGRKPGETVVKVHYWSCVKEPYTVYRQVARQVCVKQPRYEKVKVPITRYECRHCGGAGCDQCDGGCNLECPGAGCDPGGTEAAAPTQAAAAAPYPDQILAPAGWQVSGPK